MSEEQRIIFAALYQEHFEKLCGYAYRFVSDWWKAEVVTQEAFSIAAKKYKAFFKSENQIGWLKVAIRKVAANMTRTARKREEVVLSLETMRVPPSQCDCYEGVHSIAAHCAEILSKEEYALFERAVIFGESYPSVAAAFGISESACRKRVQRMIKKLRENW